jgi:hypothetical protein
MTKALRNAMYLTFILASLSVAGAATAFIYTALRYSPQG